MDFSFTEDQEALRQLARKIFDDHCTHERLKAVEARRSGSTARVWAELAKASLLGVALPEDVGGSGLGFVELCILLEEVGRAVAPLPLWPTLVLGALPIDLFGSAAQRKRLLPGVVARRRRSSARRWSRAAGTSPARSTRDGAARRRPAGASTA